MQMDTAGAGRAGGLSAVPNPSWLELESLGKCASCPVHTKKKHAKGFSGDTFTPVVWGLHEKHFPLAFIHPA